MNDTVTLNTTAGINETITNVIENITNVSSSSNAISNSDAGIDETSVEVVFDILAGIGFLVTAGFAAKRMSFSRQQQSQSGSSGPAGGAETTVVTAFYSLICATGLLRSIWFLIPKKFWKPSYTPLAVYAFDTDHPSWVGAMLSEVVVTSGSLTLFSIFVLILVYWADILKKYFHPGSRRMYPMVVFFGLVVTLAALEVINMICFLAGVYTTEGMVLFNSLLLAVVSIVCVCEITIFSHRFRTVLKTLGAINQVSTDAQVKRIVWITVTGNLFFVSRAILEAAFATSLLYYYTKHHTVAKIFTHAWYDVYVFCKYASEIIILALMLYILQTRFNASTSTSINQQAQQENTSQSRQGYTKVPDNEEKPAYAAVV